MSTNVLAIVQARMESSRLPSKSLMGLAGKPLVDHVAARVSAAESLDRVVFAIPDTPKNDPLHDHLKNDLGVTVHRGSESDVLERFARVVEAEDPEVVVRLTADDPLKDPSIIDFAVGLLLEQPVLDYVSNSIEPSYPEGLDVEVIRSEALMAAASRARSPDEREHVTPFIWSQPDRFRLRHFRSERDLSTWRWTLDTLEDWKFLDVLLRRIGSESASFDYRNVVDLIESDAELFRLMPRQARSVDAVRRSLGSREQ